LNRWPIYATVNCLS